MSTMRIMELPESERPRERLAKNGAAALSDSELIAIILRIGMKGASAIDLARTLLATNGGSLETLARCSVAQLAKVKGIGPTKAVQLAAAFGLGQRLARESAAKQRCERPVQIYDLLGAEMRILTKETLRVVLLDTKYNLMRVHEVSMGTMNETTAHPREIFQPALHHGAFAFVLVHNHPSGDPSPSDADRRMTTRLNEAATLMQIKMLDHVIIGTPAEGRQPWFSFREAGML